MQKANILTICMLVCLFLVLFVVRLETDVKAGPSRVEGWAAILEMNEFPEGWSDLPVEFIDSERMQTALFSLSWHSDHMYIMHDNLTVSVVQEAVEWLADNSDHDDVALLYIFTHGMWMRNVLLWNDWFPVEWEKLNTSKKILMADTCHAEEFTDSIKDEASLHISLACCSADEVAWAGLEEEGLPIIGSVWNYYFTEALCNSTADSDENGFVSVEEAFNFSTPLMQEYMSETVFTVPEFLESYHDIGIYPENYDVYPHPVIDDQYPEQLYLNLSYYELTSDLNNDGTVDIQDLFTVAKAFGSHGLGIPNPGDPPSEKWNPIADVNNDGWISIKDLFEVARDYGKTV